MQTLVSAFVKEETVLCSTILVAIPRTEQHLAFPLIYIGSTWGNTLAAGFRSEFSQ